MAARVPIKDGIKLYGLADGSGFRYFNILGELENGRGGSVISYRAKYKALDNRYESGVLREFYPKTAINLNRENDGQLSSSETFSAAKLQFAKEEAEYLNKYKLLLELKSINKNNVLGTFIPYFEIYQGMDDNENKIGSTYIWTPAPALTTFAKVCEDIRKNPYNRSEYKLAFILKSMEILVKCVKLMHGAGLLHLDINPKNFGFVKRDKELLYQSLQMFDISTISARYNRKEEKTGTLGYVESELYDPLNIATVQTDIYAIGATLFNAIIILDELTDTGYLYNDGYFKNLKYMVDNSKLIQASEHNYNPKLRYLLTKILEKCLCNRSNRYVRCEDLLEDIEEALYYIVPVTLKKQSKGKDIWVLSDIEKHIDNKKLYNAKTVIQYHVYQEPLYKYCEWKENKTNDINVAVIGLGELGRYFIDTCLQLGQINNTRLNVNVFSNNSIDREIYLGDRPALTKFFTFDSQGAKADDSYGNISFTSVDFKVIIDSRKNKHLKRSVFMNTDNNLPNYIFIALGDNELNLNVAQMCRRVADENGIKCSINFVYTGNNVAITELNGINPIYIYQDATKTVLHKEIERMAYNVHLLWEPDFGIDEGIVRKRFRSPYNYLSCVGNVISTRYKLFSIGIDLEKLSLKDASIRFDIEAKGQLLDTLIWCEHKRWVTEKITASWSQLNDLSECSGGKTRDFRHKRHVCIVRSNDISSLDGWSINNYEKWDSATEEELATLDDLDRMSVLLHRVYKKDAANARAKNLFNGEALMNIREAVKKDKCLLSKCLEWINVAKALWNGESSKVRLYKGVRNQFVDSLQLLSKESQKEINDQINIFERSFNSIILELEHKDYKKLDVDLVKKIPYILTYSTSNYLVVPYINEADLNSGNTRRFSNVASALCINPGRIIYLCDLRREENINCFGKSISAVLNLMDRKKLRSVIDLVVITKGMDNKRKIENILKQLQNDYSSRLKQIKEIDASAGIKWLEELYHYLKVRSKGKKFYAIERNETNISGYLDGNEFFNTFHCYEFDSCKGEFSFVRGCEELSFIKCVNGTKVSLSITVPDVIALDNSLNLVEKEPGFYMDYKTLWDCYKVHPSAWKLLCNELEDFSYGNDLVARFNIGRGVNSNPLKHRYIVPLKYITVLKTLLDVLSQNKVINKNYSLESISTEACEVRFTDLRNNKNIFDALFKKLVTIDYSSEINYKLEGNYLRISYDNLLVTNLMVSNTYKSQKIRVLKLLASQGLILGFNIENDIISFAYSTGMVKRLLTCAGKILEIYIYHKAKDMGCFDDVVAGCEVFWDKSDVKNEMDIIITYGFKSLFIETKSRRDGLNQEMYEKLNTLINRFGVNAKALLIADDLRSNISNDIIHMARGEKLNIKTIYKEEDITNIDTIILNMFTNV